MNRELLSAIFPRAQRVVTHLTCLFLTLFRNTWFQTSDHAEKIYSVVIEGSESIALIDFYVRTLIVRVIRVRISTRSN